MGVVTSSFPILPVVLLVRALPRPVVAVTCVTTILRFYSNMRCAVRTPAKNFLLEAKSPTEPDEQDLDRTKWVPKVKFLEISPTEPYGALWSPMEPYGALCQIFS